MFTLSFPQPEIALLTFDTPGKSVNVLSRESLGELELTLSELRKRTELHGLILISAKPTNFIAGADIREFSVPGAAGPQEIEEFCRRGQNLFRTLGELPFVTVAAVQGTCLGGGAELAIHCDRLVFAAHERTEFGFPEVKLGLIPGWGGTVRAPRRIGLANAIELITTGEAINAGRAWDLGLAADVAKPERLLSAAIAVVQAARGDNAYLADRSRLARSMEISPTEREFLGATAAAAIQAETKGRYPAPLLALETMLETATLPPEEAYAREAAAFAQLFGTPVNKALVNVFFLTERAKKPSVKIEPPPAAPQTIGVIGAGVMGAGIAAGNLRRELTTVVIDAQANVLESAHREILTEAAYDRRLQRTSPERTLRCAGFLQTSTNIAALAQCDLVIEAIVENLEAKRKFFAELEPVCGETAVIASNTSSIPITLLAESLKRPERFCGIHFFNPVRRMKLVEIVRGKHSSEETLARAAAYVQRIGKFSIVVADCAGFLVNRLLSPYLGAAIRLLSYGLTPSEVDRAAEKFGMPLGPFALYDLVGLDTALSAGRTMYEAYPDWSFASPILPALVKSGRLGRKNGQGFYDYRNKRRSPQVDPTAEALIAQYVKTHRPPPSDQIMLHLLAPMLLEGVRMLEEGTVRDARDLDIGVVFGLGFPAFRGGLMYWADSEGADSLLAKIETLGENGNRFAVPALLRETAKAQRKFYEASLAAKGIAS